MRSFRQWSECLNSVHLQCLRGFVDSLICIREENNTCFEFKIVLKSVPKWLCLQSSVGLDKVDPSGTDDFGTAGSQ